MWCSIVSALQERRKLSIGDFRKDAWWSIQKFQGPRFKLTILASAAQEAGLDSAQAWE